jgi:hypothetical protein
VGRLGLLVSMASMLVMASCHLADDKDPPKCEEGSHPERDMCIQDETEKLFVVLNAAATCPTISPETITVKVNERFQFENKEATQHTIRGTSDGQVWVTVPPNGLSLGMSIVKPGTWKYKVSECGSVGTVIVQ